MKQVIVRVLDENDKKVARFDYHTYSTYETRVFSDISEVLKENQTIYIKVGNQWSRFIEYRDLVERVRDYHEEFETIEDALHYELLCYDVRTMVRSYLPRY